MKIYEVLAKHGPITITTLSHILHRPIKEVRPSIEKMLASGVIKEVPEHQYMITRHIPKSILTTICYDCQITTSNVHHCCCVCKGHWLPFNWSTCGDCDCIIDDDDDSSHCCCSCRQTDHLVTRIAFNPEYMALL